MKYGVSLSIDLNKLDKSKFKQVTKKDGSVANYLNLTTYITPEDQDQYGNHGFVKQSQSKEEREAGEDLPILGNTKIFYTDSVVSEEITEDLPF